VEKIVLCIHGFHSHGEKFVLLADELSGHPWDVYAIDLRGHGLSWEKIEDVGDIQNYALWIMDVKEFLHFLNEQYPGIPVCIVAESMGAALAIHLAVLKPKNLRSLVLLSPAFKAWQTVEFSLLMETMAFGLLGPRTKPTIPVQSKSYAGTNNPIYHQYELNDPLRLALATPRYHYQVLKMIFQLRSYTFEEFKPKTFYPTIIFYGGADHLVDFQGDLEFIKRIHTRNKDLHYIPEAAHELLTDRNALDYGIFDKITRWIERF
jgi:alpha-beta hydrolase superfamily lysophospholipase